MSKTLKASAILLAVSLSIVSAYPNYQLASVQEVKLELKNQVILFNKEIADLKSKVAALSQNTNSPVHTSTIKKIEDEIASLKESAALSKSNEAKLVYVLEQIKAYKAKMITLEENGKSLSKDDEAKLKFILDQVVSYK